MVEVGVRCGREGVEEREEEEGEREREGWVVGG